MLYMHAIHDFEQIEPIFRDTSLVPLQMDCSKCYLCSFILKNTSFSFLKLPVTTSVGQSGLVLKVGFLHCQPIEVLKKQLN